MAQHKAPTAVTFATPENRTGLGPFVQRFWKLGALTAAVVVVAIIYIAYSRQAGKKVLETSWDTLNRVAKISEVNPLAVEADAGAILAGEPSLRGTQAGPWALWMAGAQASDAGDWEKAIQALTQLKQQYPTHSLVVEKQPVGPDGTAVSMVDELLRRFEAQKAWRAKIG